MEDVLGSSVLPVLPPNGKAIGQQQASENDSNRIVQMLVIKSIRLDVVSPLFFYFGYLFNISFTSLKKAIARRLKAFVAYTLVNRNGSAAIRASEAAVLFCLKGLFSDFFDSYVVADEAVRITVLYISRL